MISRLKLLSTTAAGYPTPYIRPTPPVSFTAEQLQAAVDRRGYAHTVGSRTGRFQTIARGHK